MPSNPHTYAKALVGSIFTLAVAAWPSVALPNSGATLYRFKGEPDGAIPLAPLIEVDGILYGTTNSGGTGCDNLPAGCGTIFSITSDGKERVLHRFTGGCDGVQPNYAGLVSDGTGNFYGTTLGGGSCDSGGLGTVFRLTAKGKESVLHAFSGGSDGSIPSGSLVRDNAGNLYGATAFGGNNGCSGGGCGTVFEIAPDGTERVLYAFGGGNDGFQPTGGLVKDTQGNLFGTTISGGGASICQSGCGTVFKIAPDGTETILHAFQGGDDGFLPGGNLALDDSGNLYGTTAGGGPANVGTVFGLAPDGTETVLYSFKSGSDGAQPAAGVIMDKKGNLYGTTSAGGNNRCQFKSGCGTVFKLTPQGKETILLTFDKKNGANPYAGLLLGKNGMLYGTTSVGGHHNNGVVFQVTK